MLGLLLLPLVLSAIFGHPTNGPTPVTPEQDFSLSEMLTVNKPETVKRFEEWTPEDQQNIWELSGQFEGDIMLRDDDFLGRNGMIDPSKRWRNNELAYELDPIFSVEEKQMIHDAVKIFSHVSCVNVRPKTASDKDYVYVKGDGHACQSPVGRSGGGQPLHLSRMHCLYPGTIRHEFLHALGFWHEQSDSNRDDYVTILWDNIQKGYEYNFYKYPSNMITDFGIGYDYLSIMHYSAYAFTANGNKTIVTKYPDAVIGQNKTLSEIDIEKLNLMYKCHSK